MTTSRSSKRAKPIIFASELVQPGESRRIDLKLAGLPTRTMLDLPVTVLHGKRSGPRLWLTGGLHGDELNGLEIVREVLDLIEVDQLKGTLLAAPIVNVFGFVHRSRYLPDGRDLNRSFPGSDRGSLASRMAYLIRTEIVEGSTHGIDLHTGAADRSNLPQIRADLSDPATRRCAEAFGAPVMLHARTRDGSLRATAAEGGATVLLFEAGGAERFQRRAIDIGVEGVLGVMRHLGMLPSRRRRRSVSIEVVSSSWVRARRGGIVRLDVREGQLLKARQPIGEIADAFGDDATAVVAPFDGIVIGVARDPRVYMGDALVHLGRIADPG